MGGESGSIGPGHPSCQAEKTPTQLIEDGRATTR